MNGTILLIKTIAAHRYLFTFLDSVVYEKVVAALTDSRLVKSIMQASPIAQTSCLEGFPLSTKPFLSKDDFIFVCGNALQVCLVMDIPSAIFMRLNMIVRIIKAEVYRYVI